MKNLSLWRRFGFAREGLVAAWRRERSVRTQVLCAAGAGATLLILRPAPVWWALVVLTCACVLATEILNSALEALIDRLHPEQHPEIKAVKDMAAAAVLVIAMAALAVAGLFVWETMRP